MSWVLPRRHRIRIGEQAFAVPLVIPAALLLILGAVTLMSRTTSSYLAITKQADALAARQAAESGMDRVLSVLNPFAKFTSDPYLSYLLASRWVPDSGITLNTGVTGSTVVRSGWRLTTLGRTEVQTLLRRCGLASRGQHPNQLPPANETGYRDILSGATGIQSAGTKTTLRYIVTDYVPPTPPTSSVPWPQECADFTTLSGGSAQITVEGRVIRSGRLISRYSLTRTIDVQGWPLPTMPASWTSTRVYPQPTGLRIAGTATDLSRITTGRYSYGSFLTEASPTANTVDPVNNSMPLCLNYCPNGRPVNGVDTRIPQADIIPIDDGDLPRHPFNTNTPPSGLTPLQVNDSNPNYPYKTSNTDIGNLVDECKPSETTDLNRPNQFRPNEIDCWIQSVGIPASIESINYTRSSNTFTITLASPARYDVRVGERIKVVVGRGQFNGTIVGTVSSTSSSGNPIRFTPDGTPPANDAQNPNPNGTVSPETPITLTVNTQARPVNLIVLGDVGTATNPVSIKHMVQKSPAQNFVHSIASINVRGMWNRLRIFGRQTTGAACSSDQSLFIRPNVINTANGEDASLAGSFVWLPRGTLVYGSAGQTSPSELLSVWWVCNLDVANLSGAMMLISPFVGIHDDVNSVVPGGFINASGMFVPDLRFPVYPSLQRIRSTF